MLVLKGSTSTSTSVQADDTVAMPHNTSSTAYFTRLSSKSVRTRKRFCARPSARAPSANSSCKAPKGHSQPQKVPRPHTTSVTKVNPHNSTAMGSANKNSKLLPAINASMAAVMLTMVSWPWAYQPMKARVKVRKATRKTCKRRRVPAVWRCAMSATVNISKATATTASSMLRW